jgi:hypothetical protein
MAYLVPTADDYLGPGGHVKMHTAVQVDAATPDGSLKVDSAGNLLMAKNMTVGGSGGLEIGNGSIALTADGTYQIACGVSVNGRYTFAWSGPNRFDYTVLEVAARQYDVANVVIVNKLAYNNQVVLSNFRVVKNVDSSVVYLVVDVANRNGGTTGLAVSSTGTPLSLSATTGGLTAMTNNVTVRDKDGNFGFGTQNPRMLLQIKSYGGLHGSSNDLSLFNNIYASGGWKRLTAGFGTSMVMSNQYGTVVFYTSESGDADTTATLVETIRITNTGTLLPGVSNTQDLGSSAKRFQDLFVGTVDATDVTVSGSESDIAGFKSSYAGMVSLSVEATDNAGIPALRLKDSGAGGASWRLESGRTAGFFTLYDATVGAIRLTADTSGNIGIGNAAPRMPLQIASYGGLDGNANQLIIRNNGYYSGGDKRLVSGYATKIEMYTATGNILFKNAGTGDADSAITFTEVLGILINGTLQPGADNTQTLGSAARRWSVVYAGTGTINTSDEREKTVIAPMSNAELAASKELAREIGTFQYLSALMQKGEGARSHVGMTVQRAIAIMQSHGLDPFAYGFICYDEWEEKRVEHPARPAKVAVVDDDGCEVEAAVPEMKAWTEVTQSAGNQYGFRHDELLLFLARGFEERITMLESRGKE